ncbi:MAG TPA: NepR family anti-sigma factor [Kiloniellaceae bacterium]
MMNDERDTAPDRRPPAAAKKAGSGKEDWIGAHLRRVYDEALSEPVPDRFLSILKKIDQKERRS